MGWPFGGVWEGRSAADAAEIMSALCLAVNQRQAFLGITETSWRYNNSGDSKTRPSATDFSGMSLYGQYSKENNVSLVSGISGLLGTWREYKNSADTLTAGRYRWWDGIAYTGSNYLTTADLEATHGVTLAVASYPLDVDALNTYRIFLGSMTKALWQPDVKQTTIFEGNGLSDPDADTAWGLAVSDISSSSGDAADEILNARGLRGYITDEYRATMITKLEKTFDATNIAGSLIKSTGYLSRTNGGSDGTSGSLGASLLLSGNTIGAFSSDVDSESWVDIGGSWPTLGADVTATFSFSPGTTFPYTIPVPPGSSDLGRIDSTRLRFNDRLSASKSELALTIFTSNASSFTDQT